MNRRGGELFPAIRSVGGLLPWDVLGKVADGRGLEGLTEADYHLPAGERLREVISRSWIRLVGAWASLRPLLDDPDARLTTETRERWLLPLFAELGYGRLLTAKAVSIDGIDYPISHGWGPLPIHLLGAGVPIDRRSAGVAGASTGAPHALVQELLNRSAAHMWGIVANGRVLRLLRDNVSLTRQAYVEFDLQAMFDGELFADFRVLWLACHQSRVEVPDTVGSGDLERPGRLADCWLERWAQAGVQEGTRALDALRAGVEAALVALGNGFVAHPSNTLLRKRLDSGDLTNQELYRQLLRVVYRLLFLFVAEDRGLLLSPTAASDAVDRYTRYYSTARLRSISELRRGTRHADLWAGLRVVMDRLGDDEGCAALGLPAMGGGLWDPTSTEDVGGAELANRDLLTAIRALAFTIDGTTRRPVDYRNLGAEELGSVYESLLELHPDVDLASRSVTLGTVAGHERKTTGSYYTPSSLVQQLLDTALQPVLDEAAASPAPEAAILALTVVDPACGSGHFLIGAAHRIARRLASTRTGEGEPPPEAMRTALRDVIGRCIYGVDLNPMAVELCKVALWMEALEPGRPLSFLDHHVKVGNALLGATPALLADGVATEAFKELTGDDKKVAAAVRKRNTAELREGHRFVEPTLLASETGTRYDVVHGALADVEAQDDWTIADVRAKAARWKAADASPALRHARRLADAWCAAFVWPLQPKAPQAPTTSWLRQLAIDEDALPDGTRAEVERLAADYRWFHWHLEFPQVLGVSATHAPAGWTGGFSVVLGNPPWEHTELKEQEWFARRSPEIARLPGARRKQAIRKLATDDPELLDAYLRDLRVADGLSHFIRSAGRFPLCGKGRINTYAIFAETNRMLVASDGRAGFIVPSGIATDDTTKHYFGALVDTATLVSLYDFVNDIGMFPGVGHGRQKFTLLTLAGLDRPCPQGEFGFFLQRPEDLNDPDRRFPLTADDIRLLNPNTKTCPIFRTHRDAEMTKAIYRRMPILVDDTRPDGNPWGISFMQGLFNMTSASGLFRTREQLETAGWTLVGNVFTRGNDRCLPLYEAKMLHHFDHRYGDYALKDPRRTDTALPEAPLHLKQNPQYVVMPRYWVPEPEVDARLAGRWGRQWLLGWRDICRSTDERTVIASLVPRSGVGHKMPLALPSRGDPIALYACMTSAAFDFVARQKLGGTSLTYFYLKQFPILPPAAFDAAAGWDHSCSIQEWLRSRVVELSYTASDLAPFASDVGFAGSPFRWDTERRPLLRAELDAAFFHLYGMELDDVDYILDTFPIVRRKDEAVHGDYRTKRVILEIYEEMAEAVRSGTPYKTRLDPPPAHPSVRHPATTAHGGK